MISFTLFENKFAVARDALIQECSPGFERVYYEHSAHLSSSWSLSMFSCARSIRVGTYDLGHFGEIVWPPKGDPGIFEMKMSSKQDSTFER